MSFLTITKALLRWPSLLLYVVFFIVGYVWGHISGGFHDGKLDAYRETE